MSDLDISPEDTSRLMEEIVNMHTGVTPFIDILTEEEKKAYYVTKENQELYYQIVAILLKGRSHMPVVQNVLVVLQSLDGLMAQVESSAAELKKYYQEFDLALVTDVLKQNKEFYDEIIKYVPTVQ